MENTQIIILAGGKGTRMESEDPKSLTSLSGKPFLEHILDTIDTLENQNKPIVVVGYKKEMVIERIGNDRCNFAIQEEQLGTGHAVLITENLVDDKNQTILVLYTDHPLISKKTISSILEKQKEFNTPIVMATTKVPNFEGWYGAFIKWGRIKRNEDRDVENIIEYKDATEEEKEIKEVNPAYFAFDGSWLFDNLKKVSNQNNQKEYYLTDLIKIAFLEGYNIPTIDIPPEEAIGANSKDELNILENIYNKKNKDI
jgi:bifunctional UDP-N-acetylglucosamine pyrophosphorylase/glucosamine-1-phosphate N-acetyltransferase